MNYIRAWIQNEVFQYQIYSYLNPNIWKVSPSSCDWSWKTTKKKSNLAFFGIKFHTILLFDEHWWGVMIWGRGTDETKKILIANWIEPINRTWVPKYIDWWRILLQFFFIFITHTRCLCMCFTCFIFFQFPHLSDPSIFFFRIKHFLLLKYFVCLVDLTDWRIFLYMYIFFFFYQFNNPSIFFALVSCSDVENEIQNWRFGIRFRGDIFFVVRLPRIVKRYIHTCIAIVSLHICIVAWDGDEV